MSRVVVKNLPKQISQEELKKHFNEKGNITDVRLIHKNGEFRRFAFIGFEGEDDGGAACDYFNNTFIKQAKVTVEICHDLGSEEKPASWAEKNKKRKEKKSKASQLITNNNIETETKKKGKKMKDREKDQDSLKEKLLGQYKDDPTFGEFLKANKKAVKEEEGEEEAVLAEEKESNSEAEEDAEEEDDKLAQKKDISDQDYLKSLMKDQPQDKDHIEGKDTTNTKNKKKFYTVVIRATEMCKAKESKKRSFTKKAIKAFLKPLKYKSLRIPNNVRMVAYVGFKTEKEVNQLLQKDKSFLDGVRVHIVKFDKSPDNTKSDSSSSQQNNTPWSLKEEALKQAESVAESGKLFVRNLWYSVTEELLQELFQKYGEVTDVTLPICKYSRQSKGFATVTFLFPEHAVKAMAELDGTNFKGRILHILPAVEPKTEEKQKENLSFKEKKAQEKKATAGSWHNWNTLFMGSGAVVDIMAERYNRSKMEILDSEGKQSVAVNLALGETQVVDETKRFLEDNGVSLEAFSNPGVQRSKTVFLVKNLPARTTAQELMELFCKFGELGRVVLPPSGLTGVVEFLNSGEAKKAFRNLAYSKFKSTPLYLEWAPIQVFKTEFVAKPVKTEEEEHKDTEGKSNKEEPSADRQLDPEPDTTVYVKNLNFTTTEDVLKQHFEKIGSLSSVMIAKRRGESQGYGFVQFLRRADAQKALREMNESSLEGHKLQIKLSQKTLVTNVKSARRIHDAGVQTSSKIMVKNIPFQATSKEVRQLFVTFGELKSVRLPNKPGSSEHRGFGFVDFVSRQDAKKAFEALGLSTHLYDRRLVLEWAKEDETVEELRKRTAQHFLGSGSIKKRAKVQMDAKKNEDSDND